MTEVEVQQRAKRYLDCLVQGINPLDGTVIPEGDTVRQVRIARCLQYVSGILEQVIENHGEVQRVKKKAFRTPAVFADAGTAALSETRATASKHF